MSENYLEKVLETERLILKPITVHDAEFYLSIMNSPSWHKFIGDRGVYTLEAARDYVKDRMVSQWLNLGYGNYIVWLKGTTDNEEATAATSVASVPIGAIGIFTRPGLEYSDLGFALLSGYEGRGYATEGSQRLLHEAKNIFGIKVLQAITDPKNTSCQRLLTRLQFNFEGLITLPNETKETMLYKLCLHE